MSSSMESQAPVTAVKFPVICHAEIDSQLLNTILENDLLVLVAQPDLSELITSNDRPIDGIRTTFQTPFKGTLPDDVVPMVNFMAAAKAREGISSKAFVILDGQTAQDGGRTCQVTSYNDTTVEDDGKDPVPFRCELSSAIAALEAMEQSPDGRQGARTLRNEAAVAGGVWSLQSAAEQHAKALRIKPADYPPSDAWDTNSGPQGPEGSLPHVAVFRTTDIKLKTLNKFIQETYEEADGETIAFVTSLHHPFHSGPVNSPLSETPPNPSILQGASPRECDTLVRHLFAPQDRSELNYNYFIIVDELTEQTETVLLACNREYEGELQLLRCDFPTALSALLAPMSTILTMEKMASEAAERNLGVSRD